VLEIAIIRNHSGSNLQERYDRNPHPRHGRTRPPHLRHCPCRCAARRARGHHHFGTLADRERPEEPFDVDTLPIHDLGPWPEGLSLRREDMYDEDGR